jgi:hypothetical protein
VWTESSDISRQLTWYVLQARRTPAKSSTTEISQEVPQECAEDLGRLDKTLCLSEGELACFPAPFFFWISGPYVGFIFLNQPIGFLLYFYILFFFCFGSTGVWTQSLGLAERKNSITWTTPSSFCFRTFFQVSSHVLVWASIRLHSSYLCFLNSLGYKCVEMGSFFLLRMTGVSLCSWPFFLRQGFIILSSLSSNTLSSCLCLQVLGSDHRCVHHGQLCISLFKYVSFCKLAGNCPWEHIWAWTNCVLSNALYDTIFRQDIIPIYIKTPKLPFKRILVTFILWILWSHTECFASLSLTTEKCPEIFSW